MNNEKIEDMLTQLIKIVGNIQSDIQGMQSDIRGMKSDIQGLQSDVQGVKADIQEIKAEARDFKAKSEARHEAVMTQLKTLENDQDFIWEKAVRNERELGNLKRQLS
ncbi:hypothetical protein AWH56_005630 [Anaerobacillus isosaccharinicus]|uniref:Uncharacterized protein n=1 Tax=Anaerobacillus isosaccharinicus TaxID=1532552 RepID=A0A1S2L445_9BACI|nr:hypothetical protein [Anaerobacillus isosaccharinicus]MBA5584493.1 hypothetical protein [Anaerobacillus isosaccharinicus]QOY37123.1 hypothetical protein AWH56_005630 [Anaerobacillus isosaccharinicus]